jgi:hypothetical protein
MSIIIEKIYLDDRSDSSLYPPNVPPPVLNDLRYSVSFASNIVKYAHTLYIVFRNVHFRPVRVKTAVLTSTDQNHQVHTTAWSEWTNVDCSRTVPIHLSYGVQRILKIEFEIDEGVCVGLNDATLLCAALERLEKNAGSTTRFVLIAQQEGKDPYVVHSPMGPLDVLTVLNKAQAGVIKDTASLIGEL